MSMTPLKYMIYKGLKGTHGAIQFQFTPPHFYCTEEKKHKYFGDDIPWEANFSKKVPCRVEGCDGVLSSREGCVFVDACSATGENIYDWDNKVPMSLSIKDIGLLLVGLRSGAETKIFHDPNMKSEREREVSRQLVFSSPGGVEKGGIITVSESVRGQGVKTHRIPLSRDEVLNLIILFQAVIPKMLAWE